MDFQKEKDRKITSQLMRMVTFAWDERVLEAMAGAKDASLEQFEAVCKLAFLVFHSEKQSRRRLTRTASALGWSNEQAEDLVLALAKILMDTAKAEASEAQLQASLHGMSLPSTHATMLSSMYSEHRELIKQSSSRPISQSTPAYLSLEWRVDLEIANRVSRNNPTPVVTLELNTVTIDSNNLPRPQSTCLLTDFATLKKLQTTLETALNEVDSVHSSRMQRYLH